MSPTKNTKDCNFSISVTKLIRVQWILITVEPYHKMKIFTSIFKASKFPINKLAEQACNTNWWPPLFSQLILPAKYGPTFAKGSSALSHPDASTPFDNNELSNFCLMEQRMH